MACIELWNKNPYAPNAASHAMKAMLSKITRGSGFTMLVLPSICLAVLNWGLSLNLSCLGGLVKSFVVS